MKRAEVVIARRREEVHALLEQIDAHERFLDHFLTDWKPISRTRIGSGAAVRVRVKRGGRHEKLIVRIIKSSHRRLIVETRGGKKYRRRARGTYEFAEKRAGTRVRFSLELLEGKPVDRLTWPLERRRMVRRTQEGLERLKAQMESEPDRPAQASAPSRR